MNTREEKSPAHDFAESSATAGPRSIGKVLCPIAILVATCAAFWPALGHDFVSWDDDKIIYLNPNIRGLTAANLRWMFTTFYMCHYQPLGWLSYGLDYSLWGLNPRGYFLSNILIHVAAAMAFYFLSQRLFRHSASWSEVEVRLGATAATLFFALHPLRAESVAWASERRDVLSGLFLLLAVLAYVKWLQGQKQSARVWYWMSLGAYSASLLSKATGVGLPLVLLVLDWYPLQRWGCRHEMGRQRPLFLVVEKLPYVLLAGITVVLAILAQREADTIATFQAHGFVSRVFCAAYGLVFYVQKTLAPTNLSPLVPMPGTINPLDIRFLGNLMFALIGGGYLFLERRRFPLGITVLAIYVILLLPVLGLVQIGPQLVADRYSYLACLGFAILFGTGFVLVFRKCQSKGPGVVAGCAATAILILGVLFALCRVQVGIWRNSETLWRHALTIYPDSAIAQLNMGTVLGERSQFERAIRHFERAIELAPGLGQAHYGLGNALLGLGRPREAQARFQAALDINPQDAEAWNNLGACFLQQGEFSRACEAFERSVAIAPESAMAHNNLGHALAACDQFPQAIAHWRRAAELLPDSALACVTLAWQLATHPEDSVRNGAEALAFAERACRLTARQDSRCLDALAAAYAELGRYESAAETVIEAIRVARAQSNSQAIAELELRLDHYRSQKPYRVPAR